MSENNEIKQKEIKADLKDTDKSTVDKEKVENKKVSLEEKLKETESKLLRSLAEIENQRRRFEREIKDAFEFGSFNFAKESLAILDNLQRAKEAIKNDKVLKENKDLDSSNVHKFSDQKYSNLPLYGKIAAGTPIEAIQHEVDKIALPDDLQKNGEYFGLKVKGDSMIEAGINDGDTVIIKKTSTADSGQIAVVLIDEQEATLKRIRKKGNTIALEAANKNYDTKIYASNRIKIQGRLISLYRNFH